MTLAKKLRIKLITFTLALAGASVAVLWGLIGLHHLADTSHEEFDELRLVQQAHKHLDQATIAIGRSQHNSAIEHLQNAESELQAFEDFQESRESAQDEAHTSMEARVVEEVLGLMDRARSRLLLMRIKDQQSAVDLSAAVEDIGLAMEAVVSMTTEMEQVVSEVQDQTIARLGRMTWGLGALFVVLLAGATVANILQYRKLTGELNYLQDGARRLAAGNMSVRLCAKADGEFEQLQRDFNYMAAELESLYNDLEERVAAKSKQLAVSERRASVGYLAAGVAHEVNNPLGIISGYAESLLRQIRSQTAKSSDLSAIVSGLGIIRDEAFRCKHITQGLLDLSHLGEEHRVLVSIRQVMDDVAQLAHASPAGRDREITVQADGPNDPLHVLGSSPELKQVALNLIINALQSVSQGTGRVVLDATRCNGWIEMCVRDNGSGMDPSTIEHIFEPFYTQGKARQGVGLGLSISQAIAEQHGGAIIAASEGPDRGSVFTFRLPAAKDDSA